MSRGKIGPISKKIRDLCYGLSSKKINEEDFKKGIKGIIDKYGNMFYQISASMRKWCKDNENAWKLANEVDDRIEKAFEKYKEKFIRDKF